MELFWIFIYIAVLTVISLTVRWILIHREGRRESKKRDAHRDLESKAGEKKKND